MIEAREDLIAYLEAVLRVYNLHGRRDNKYKARIKILVKALTPEVFAQKVEAEFEQRENDKKLMEQAMSGFRQCVIDVYANNPNLLGGKPPVLPKAPEGPRPGGPQ